jgi:hypothetical protein
LAGIMENAAGITGGKSPPLSWRVNRVDLKKFRCGVAAIYRDPGEFVNTLPNTPVTNVR